MPHIHEKIDFTVNAFIVHDKRVLLLMHRKLQTWLPPGGHIELDEDPLQALWRETQEESGLTREHLTLVQTGESAVNDCTAEGFKALPAPAFCDIHKISDTHRHSGMNYIFTSDTDKVSIEEKESEKYHWFSADDLASKGFTLKQNIRAYGKKALEIAGR